jgi:cytochrome c553
LCLLLTVTTAAVAAESTVGYALSVHCVDCHGNDGYSARGERPNLAHQKEDYLALQLRRFRAVFIKMFGGTGSYDPVTAQRDHPVMNHQAGHLSDDAIKNIAAYYAGLPCKSRAKGPPLPRPAVAEVCIQCHGAGGVSASPNIPNLAGQNEPYLLIQLKAFRKSTIPLANAFVFPNRRHPEMSRLARHLTNADLRAIAAYFTRLPCS